MGMLAMLDSEVIRYSVAVVEPIDMVFAAILIGHFNTPKLTLGTFVRNQLRVREGIVSVLENFTGRLGAAGGGNYNKSEQKELLHNLK